MGFPTKTCAMTIFPGHIPIFQLESLDFYILKCWKSTEMQKLDFTFLLKMLEMICKNFRRRGFIYKA